MNGAAADWDHTTVIGKKPGKPKATRKESDVNGMSFTGIEFAFICTPLHVGECCVGDGKS